MTTIVVLKFVTLVMAAFGTGLIWGVIAGCVGGLDEAG